MDKIEHKFVSVNGINMHVAELGEGPVVLFLHGFPELWYSWRHQIMFMASHGYKAIAPDLRGYGDSMGGVDLNDISKFTIHHLVGDLVALLDGIGVGEEEKVFVVGHDWGAIIAWYFCLFRSDKIKALVNLSVPFIPRDPNMDLVQQLRAAFGDDYYVVRFQEPGDIEAELAKIDIKTVMKRFFSTGRTLNFPKGEGFGDSPVVSSSWLTDEDLDYYATKFKETGFTGGVNYYRALHKTWELTAPWQNAKVVVPTKFVMGDEDLVYYMPGMKDYVHNGRFEKDVSMLKEKIVLKGITHFIQQVIPDEINHHILNFFQKF
ncbi:hydrolase [Lithospermum erythrorhizon]|uniref:soluble epoxide hydrolase n=1 Tax=Lithospermum erythrorhizon TaxID=34254 RepID=A0AAV3RHR8_LITER